MKKTLLLFCFLFLSGCSLELAKSLLISASDNKKNLAHYKVGNPYMIDGKWYYPSAEPDYEEVGIASWYGSEFHDRLTANGEIFDKNKVSAAHRTLPMPSIVRVTNLENGKTMLLRVNDRGPFAHDRILDLSEKAAKLLGVYKKGTARVKVQFDKKTTAMLFDKEGTIKPPSEEKTHQAERIEYPVESGYFIQVGAFGVYGNAQNVANQLKNISSIRIEKVEFPDIVLHRVRVGPFADVKKAGNTLKEIKKLGFKNAIIVSG